MKSAQTLYSKYVEAGELPEPVERLRAFCSFAMGGQDWIDAETYFDAVTAELEALRAEVDAMKGEDHADRCAQSKRLKVQCEALRADAERYRWLRERNWFDSPLAVVRNPAASVKLGRECPSGDRLDSAIDEARKGAA